MNTKHFTTIALVTWTLLVSGAVVVAQEDQPVPASPSLAPPVIGITDDGNGNVRVTTGGTVTRRSFLDANGNGTMSVFDNGVQQDYVVSPNGTIPAGTKLVGDSAPDFNAQLFEQARQRAANALKDLLGCTDAEWAVLWPKIQLIQVMQNAVTPSAKMSATPGGQSVPAQVNTVYARLQEFQKLVGDKGAPEGRVAQALASVRDARSKVKTELAQARKDLTDLVTPRQEAILYQKGILAD